MKLVICASIQFTEGIDEVAKSLRSIGHSVEIPLSSQRILDGELTLEEFNSEKNRGEGANQKIQDDVIKYYYEKIKECDGVLILNHTKNDIENYIGGNTFLEMGFAHVLNKKIFLLNSIPEISYTDEIQAMRPIILEGDLSKIG